MFIRPLVAAAAIAVSSFLPISAAAATPSRGRSAERSINALVATVARTGTSVYLECPENVTYMGFYSSAHRALAICVDGRDPVTWTEDERDTLRHEAIHLVQDCMGRIGDNELETTATIAKLMRVAMSSGLNLEQIEKVYRANGADDLTILLEWEAFSLAYLLNEEEVEQMVSRACNVTL